MALARAHGMTVAVTGPEDYVTDGTREARVRNGHPLMARVTGTGCASTAVTGAFAAVAILHRDSVPARAGPSGSAARGHLATARPASAMSFRTAMRGKN